MRTAEMILLIFFISFISCKKTTNTPGPPPPPDTLNNGLMAYYPFSGNTNDQTGKNSTGIVHAATPTTDLSGKANSAYSFNGNDSYIIFTPGDSLKKIQTVTISFKVFSEAVNNSEFLFYWGQDGITVSKARYQFYFSANTGERDAFFHVSEPSYCYFSYILGTASNFTDVNENEWHSIIGVFNGSSIKFFYDGILKDQQPVTYTPTATCIDDQSIILGMPLTTYYTSYKGKIDELRIYNRELTQEEINRLKIL